MLDLYVLLVVGMLLISVISAMVGTRIIIRAAIAQIDQGVYSVLRSEITQLNKRLAKIEALIVRDFIRGGPVSDNALDEAYFFTDATGGDDGP